VTAKSGQAPDSGTIVAGAEFRVRGLVQGVGFRPAVWRLARRFGLVGEVLNDGAGVLIRAWGAPERLSGFETALSGEAPPLARVETVERAALPGPPAAAAFEIVASEAGEITTGVAPDAATCPACLAEIFDPANRRHRYPFTNCTHCGPRLSIVRAIPYDRASTSMAAFPMCEACRAEYENPADRRFHAEPNACPSCGPRAWIEDEHGNESPLLAGEDAIRAAARLIRAGAIVAVKGIGGFHLACDGASADAVARLRRRKQRHHKPFALMARDLAEIARAARVSEAEAALLSSPASPIVVLERRPDAGPLAPELAPGQSSLGFMLPYTPLHHLLMADLDGPVVLTSGNRSDEPQCIDNMDARNRLAGVADLWLTHDRDIVNRQDDSVARVVLGAPSLSRRARGYAPEPIRLPPGFSGAPRVLALGAELKSAFCLLGAGRAILSQHIGDLEDAATHGDFRAALGLYRNIFAFEPEIIAIDVHPDYLSTQWGHVLARETGARIVPVQHHHAHAAAVLAEHGVGTQAPPVLGVVLDGLGLGENGELWGGEFLRADYRGFERLAAFAAVPLIGGNRAMREPWRNAFAHLNQFIGWREIAARHPDLGIVRLIGGKQPAVLERMAEAGVNAPRASSAGRLFDAVAAVLGVCAEGVSYEGQAAIELEALAAGPIADERNGYPVEIVEGAPQRISWGPFWRALLGDLVHGRDMAVIAARVHRGLIGAVAATARNLCAAHGMGTVVLSGGVFQNRILLEGAAEALRGAGLAVLTPCRVPANDGGLSLGQAVLAAAQGRPSDRSCRT